MSTIPAVILPSKVRHCVLLGKILKVKEVSTMNKLEAARKFWNNDKGHYLTEYTLLMAFVTLASAALFVGASDSISGIWKTTNSQLAAATPVTVQVQVVGDRGKSREGAAGRQRWLRIASVR